MGGGGGGGGGHIRYVARFGKAYKEKNSNFYPFLSIGHSSFSS